MGHWKVHGERPELALFNEWCAVKHPDARVTGPVQVGADETPPELPGVTPAQARMFNVFRRYADGLIVYPDRVFLVEASILPKAEKIGQLKLYMALWPSTPEYAHLKGRPVTPVILVAVNDDVVQSIAAADGFLWEVFTPDWVKDYLALRFPGRTPKL